MDIVWQDDYRNAGTLYEGGWRARCIPLKAASVSSGQPQGDPDAEEFELYSINASLIAMVLDCRYNSDYLAVMGRSSEGDNMVDLQAQDNGRQDPEAQEEEKVAAEEEEEEHLARNVRRKKG